MQYLLRLLASYYIIDSKTLLAIFPLLALYFLLLYLKQINILHYWPLEGGKGMNMIQFKVPISLFIKLNAGLHAVNMIRKNIC